MSSRAGKIITFYSYKGGTGRSMALANVAWILASNGHRVLAIDWDLEAPGLHRYFRPFLIDAELSDTLGLIDFFWSYSTEAMTPAGENSGESDRWQKTTDLGQYTVQLDWSFPKEGCLDLVCAGRQNAGYAELVNSFDWTNLYRRLDGATLFQELRQRLKQEYDYVLVDSRTGVSDTSGICTVAMPDSLVALFTLGRQSVVGVAAVLESLLPQRPENDLAIFPVVTRVELAEKERLEAAIKRARGVFTKYLASQRVSNVGHEYWDDAEIQYQPYYAYEEVLAPFGDPTGSERSAKSLLAAMERLTGRITGITGITMPLVPEAQRKRVLGQFAGTETKEAAQPQAVEDPEERRQRAERYFASELRSPIEYFSAKARQARLASRNTTLVVSLSCFAVPLLIVLYSGAWGPVDLSFRVGAVVASGSAGVAKCLELIQPPARARPFGFATLVLLLGSIAAQTIMILSRPTSTAVEATANLPVVGYALGLALIGFAAQAMALVTRREEIAVRLAQVSSELQRQFRAYVNRFGEFEGERDPSKEWRRFIEISERIVAEGEAPLKERL